MNYVRGGKWFKYLPRPGKFSAPPRQELGGKYFVTNGIVSPKSQKRCTVIGR